MNILQRLFKKIQREKVLDLLFIFTISLTPLLWLKGNFVIDGHDAVSPLNPISFLYGRLFTWIGHGFGQSQSLIIGTIPIHFIDAIPSFFGLSVTTAQKLVFIFWFFAMGAAMYILASVLKKESRIFKLTAVILYVFNFFILQAWWIVERTKFSAYTAFPLILAIFLMVRFSKITLLKGILINLLILFIFNGGGLYGIPLFGGFFIAILVLLIYFTIFDVREKQYFLIKKTISLFLFTLIGYFIINAYFILPAISSIVSQYSIGVGKAGGTSGFVDWASIISANASFINIFRLQGIPDWYDNPTHPYAKYFRENIFLIIVSYLWPFLTFLPIFLYKKRETIKIIIYFLLMYLVGAFFVAGTHPPLGAAYAFLIQKIPGFIMFRTPYLKFAPAIFLSSSILMAYSLDFLNGKKKHFSFLILLIIIFVYHFPFFTGNFFSWKKGFSTRLEFPSYIFQFNDWLNREVSDDKRVLMLPPNNPDLQYSAYTWGYLSFQAIPTLFSNKAVIVNNDRINNSEKSLIEQLYKSILENNEYVTEKLLTMMNIKYLVLQEDVLNDPLSPYPMDYMIYRNIIENNLHLKPKFTFGKWIVYSLEGEIQKAFISNKIDVLSAISKDHSYFDFRDNAITFISIDDLPPKLPLNEIVNNYYYIPHCVSCFGRDTPFIRLPERNILPDSPLYPLVIFNENINLHNKDIKNLIYDYLGLSLKRTAEIREMITKNKKIDDTVVDRYLTNLKNIKTNFNKITLLEDKIQLGEDINYYMWQEKIILIDILGIYVSGGEYVFILGRILQENASVIDAVQSYVAKYDPETSKVFRLTLLKGGFYDIYLKKDSIPVATADAKFAILIDNTTQKEVVNGSDTVMGKWLHFGKTYMTKGLHTIFLSFPELPQLMEILTQSSTEFNYSNGSCYSGKIQQFLPKKVYRLELTYTNNISNDILFYISEITKGRKILTSVHKLRGGIWEEKIIKLIQSSADAGGIEIGICSPVQLRDFVEKDINLKINEFIYPSFLVIYENETKNTIQPVNIQKISPTKYKVTINSAGNSSSILHFMERFDTGWKLSLPAQHIKVDGFANGWIINNRDKEIATIEYTPQKAFIIGYLISGIGVVFICIYLFYSYYYEKQRN